MYSGSAVAALNRRESGKEMEMGFASGSVVPLPTANSHAKEEYVMKPAFQEATFLLPEKQTFGILNCVLYNICWHTPRI